MKANSLFPTVAKADYREVPHNHMFDTLSGSVCRNCSGISCVQELF